MHGDRNRQIAGGPSPSPLAGIPLLHEVGKQGRGTLIKAETKILQLFLVFQIFLAITNRSSLHKTFECTRSRERTRDLLQVEEAGTLLLGGWAPGNGVKKNKFVPRSDQVCPIVVINGEDCLIHPHLNGTMDCCVFHTEQSLATVTTSH